jgi:acyl transferase domain-containing protein
MTIGSTDAGLNDVAIVGMALRVPGARNTGEFWENLRNGVESVRTLSDAELEASGEDPVKAAQPNYIPRTADIPDMELFDPEFFGLSPKEAAIMDPQHRHFLECAWEAIEDAGRPPETIEGPVGVYAGCGMGSYFYFNVCSDRAADGSGGHVPASPHRQRQGLSWRHAPLTLSTSKARVSTSRRPAQPRLSRSTTPVKAC